MKTRLLLFAAIISAISALTAISSAQRKPENEKPITGDFRITVRTTSSGQTSQSTTLIRGSRERTETNMVISGTDMSSVNITQCDLRRTIQINDRTRKYLITPMDSEGGSSEGSGAASTAAAGSDRRGGVVTMTVNTVDTGERKEMFGFTARHLRRTTMMQSSPDACQQQQMKIETDGWYINLEYGLNCGSGKPSRPGGMSAPGGCQDRYQYNTTGPTRLGYPLVETTMMYGPDGRVMYTTSREVIDLSRQTLDAVLFEVPAGYTAAANQQELSGAPSTAEIMTMSGQQSGGTSHSNSDNSTSSAAPSAPAKIRIGVVEFNNKTKTAVSTDSLREQLVATLNGNGIDAITLNASSPNEVAIEAKAKGCSYVLYTDVSALKNASGAKKLGGLFGRATGVGSGDSGKSEARFEFRLIPTGSSSPALQSSALGKEDTQEASVNAALQSEAMAVTSAVNKL